MFYYVIYNSTALNYSGNNKNLNTFIYGSVLYILSHGLIMSYDNQFSNYIKSYFWFILLIDMFAVYYLYTYITPQNETETNDLKTLITSFYNNTKDKDNIKENTRDNTRDNTRNKDNPNDKEDSDYEETNEDNDNNDMNNNMNNTNTNNMNNMNNMNMNNMNNMNNTNNMNNNIKKTKNNNMNNNEPEPFKEDDYLTEIEDQMSDAGSDIDLDKFEMSLQN
jgi:hypothetical protein